MPPQTDAGEDARMTAGLETGATSGLRYIAVLAYLFKRFLGKRFSWFVDDERDAADDEIVGGVAGIDLDEVDGEGDAVRA